VALLGILACAAGYAALHGGFGSPETAAAAAPAVERTAAAAPDSGPRPSAVDRQRPAAGPAGWQRLVGELYRRRAQAFTTGSGALLGDVYTAASPQLAADERSLAALAAARQRVRGFRPRVQRVTAVTVSGDRASLALIDGWPAYRVVRADGSTVAPAPARGATAVRMVLARTPEGWRIDTVARAG
jgi:hypothetical protein